MIKVKKYFKIVEVQADEIISNMTSFNIPTEIIGDTYYKVKIDNKDFELRIRDMSKKDFPEEVERSFKLKLKNENSEGNQSSTVLYNLDDIKEQLNIELKSKIEDFLSGITSFMRYEIERRECKKGNKSFRVDFFTFDNGEKDSTCRVEIKGVKEDEKENAYKEIEKIAIYFRLEKQDMSPKEEYLEKKKILTENKEIIKSPFNKIH